MHRPPQTANIAIATYSMLLLAVLASTSVAQTDSATDWKLFRNDEFLFRLTYPPDWVSKPGQGANVKAKVSSNRADGASCNVVALRVPELAGLTPEQVMAEISYQDVAEQMVGRFPGAQVVKGGETNVDNRPAVYAYVDVDYKVLDSSIPMRQLFVQTFAEGISYTITCGSLRSAFDQSQPIFLRIVSSFVVENWYADDPVVGPSGGLGLPFTVPQLVLSFLITWTVGLTPPLLIRFLFLRRSMRKWTAIAVCALFWSFNIVFFISIGSQSKTHGALLLVALVSYFILRSGRTDAVHQQT